MDSLSFSEVISYNNYICLYFTFFKLNKILGKGGSKIAEIRHMSGAMIQISKVSIANITQIFF